MKIFKGIVYFLAAICLLTGASDVIKGLANLESLGSTLPVDAYADPIADNIFRFFAAIWFGTGVLLILFAQDLNRYKPAMLTLMGIIVFGGIARIISIFKYGFPVDVTGASLVSAGLFAELILVPILMVVLMKFKTNYQTGDKPLSMGSIAYKRQI